MGATRHDPGGNENRLESYGAFVCEPRRRCRRLPLWLGWLCAALMAAGCASDSNDGTSPETAIPILPTEEAAPTTVTAAPASTEPAVEPSVTAAPSKEPDTAQEPPLDEPSATGTPQLQDPAAPSEEPDTAQEPPSMIARRTGPSLDEPSATGTPQLQDPAAPSEEPDTAQEPPLDEPSATGTPQLQDPAAEAPQDDEAQPAPGSEPDTEPIPSDVSEAPLTWRDIPVITVFETDTTETVEAVTTPRLLHRFDDVEVLLHFGSSVWLFEHEDAPREWTFDEAVGRVFPDGSGGIIYQDRDEIFYQAEPHSDREVLVECATLCLPTMIGGPVSLIGLAILDESREAIYSVRDCDEAPEGYGGNPLCHETLRRTSLDTGDTASLGRIGGWEWSFGNTVIVDHGLFGHWGTDGGQGLTGYDLLSGSEIEIDLDCCPSYIAPFDDAIVTAGWTYMGNDRVFIVSVYGRDAEQHRFTLPILVPDDVTGIHSLEIWDSVLVLNTLTREGYPNHSAGGYPYRAVLVDLNTQETEFYSRPGILQLVPRSAGSPAPG